MSRSCTRGIDLLKILPLRPMATCREDQQIHTHTNRQTDRQTNRQTRGDDVERGGLGRQEGGKSEGRRDKYLPLAQDSPQSVCSLSREHSWSCLPETAGEGQPRGQSPPARDAGDLNPKWSMCTGSVWSSGGGCEAWVWGGDVRP